MKAALLLFLVVAPLVAVHAQRTEEERAQIRRDKIEAILRIQDRRTIHDGKLVAAISDPDPVVRERALLAYGSLQDTSVLNLLTEALRDPVPAVQEMAAFAIGQTGTQLSPDGRRRLDEDLIWKRLAGTRAADRLIEEIGKFGTAEGLNDLLIRVGDAYPQQSTRGMLMCIARYAIRGPVSSGAVRYVLRFVKSPETAPWEAVYALQRIGEHPDIRAELEHLVSLRQHGDPLVRMNLAALLGKVREPRITLDPVSRLAEFDRDWRVQVNALKALALHPLRTVPQVLPVFRRAFYSRDLHVALTAIVALRTSDILASDSSGVAADVFDHLRILTANRSNNFPWQVQAEAAQTLAALLGPGALPAVIPTRWPQPKLQADLLRAVGATGTPGALPILQEGARSGSPITVCGALAGLHTLATRMRHDSTIVAGVRDALIAALRSDDVAITGTAASTLADSLYEHPATGVALLEAMSRQRIPDDIEALQEIIAALGALRDTRAALPLMEQLKQHDRSVATAAARALTAITGTDYSSRLPSDNEPLYTDFDFAYLRSLPDTVALTLQTGRGDVQVQLYKNVAPFTVMSILKLTTQRGYFRGLTFHRVVPNFVVQGGCPRGDGWGGPGFTLRSEFSPLRYETGTIGIASSGKDTEGSQFFFTYSPQPHLDGRYTVVGKTVSGMDVVDRLERDDRIFDFTLQP
jgi:cyclophilin family peptidyl-prolyl cis-trans isomerase/HEAT repeat protein